MSSRGRGNGEGRRGGRVGPPRFDPRNPSAAAIKARGIAPTVINKTASDVQLTAEQLLFESFDLHRRDHLPQRPELLLTTPAELEAYRQVKRQEFEALVQRDTSSLSNWLRYASWEVLQQDLAKARILYERAAEYHGAAPRLWLSYVDVECSAGAVNHARNVLVRAVAKLPFEEALWLRFVMLELTVGNIDGCRELFRQWLTHQPGPHIWRLFAHFEADYGSVESLRTVTTQFIKSHNAVATWLLVGELEATIVRDLARAENVFKAALVAISSDAKRGQLLSSLARIYMLQRKEAMAKSTLEEAIAATADVNERDELMKQLVDLDRHSGSLDDLLRDVYQRRRASYEAVVALHPGRTDTWWKLVSLERESCATLDRLRDVYDRACFSWKPPSPTHRLWVPLLQLIESYAACEELDGGDLEAAIAVLLRATDVIQSSGVVGDAYRIYLALGEAILRRLNDTDAPVSRYSVIEEFRKVMRAAIQQPAMSVVVFRRYLSVELQLGDTAAIRQIFDQAINAYATDAAIWLEYADFEAAQGEWERVDAIFQQAATNTAVVHRDELWTRRIAMKLRSRDVVGARALYLELLADALKRAVAESERVPAADEKSVDSEARVTTALVRVMNVLQLLEQFEFQHGGEAEPASLVRQRYKHSVSQLRRGLGAEASKPIVHAWRDFEARHGTTESLRSVEELLDAPAAKRRRLMEAAGQMLRGLKPPTTKVL